MKIAECCRLRQEAMVGVAGEGRGQAQKKKCYASKKQLKNDPAKAGGSEAQDI